MTSVLYDAPGPKAKIRNRVYTVVGALAVVGLLVFVALRLAGKGQFEPEMWNIFNNAGVRTNIRNGVLTTLQVFAVAAVLSLALGVLLAVAGSPTTSRCAGWRPASSRCSGPSRC